MQRRRSLLACAAAAWGWRPALAQPHPPRIGVLFNGAPGPAFDAIRRDFVADFATLGRAEGVGIGIEPRFATGQIGRLPALAAELVADGVDVVVGLGGPASVAAARATTTIPVVFSIVTDPVALGLVASAEAPGRNVTGVTSFDPAQAAYQLALLETLRPGLQRVAILSDRVIPGADAAGLAPIDRANVRAAEALGMRPEVVKVATPAAGAEPDFAAAFAEMERGGAQAVLVLELPFVFPHRTRIAALALERRLPAMFPGGMGEAGGLVAFGTTVADTWRRIPAMADRILKGESPATIPVEFVTRRDLVLNLKVAGELGLAIPPELVARADRVIR